MSDRGRDEVGEVRVSEPMQLGRSVESNLGQHQGNQSQRGRG